MAVGLGQSNLSGCETRAQRGSFVHFYFCICASHSCATTSRVGGREQRMAPWHGQQDSPAGLVRRHTDFPYHDFRIHDLNLNHSVKLPLKPYLYIAG